jgi:hypothetical protein
MNELMKLYDFHGIISFPAEDIEHADELFNEFVYYLEDKGWTAEGSVEEAGLYVDE